MPKFFVPKENIKDDKIYITSEDVVHIKKVLRLGIGDMLSLCDGLGNDFLAKISQIYDKEIICEILSRKKSDTEPNVSVTLIQGIPKGSKMEYIIQKTTELGIEKIIPCKMSRCVSKIENQKDEMKKNQRWQKISEEASKQSGRGIIPKIENSATLKEVIELVKDFDVVFAPYECEEENKLKDVLKAYKSPKKVAFIIGPEGGFDIEEIQLLKEAKIKTVTLGKRILRTETAGEAVLSMIMYEIGDINL